MAVAESTTFLCGIEMNGHPHIYYNRNINVFIFINYDSHNETILIWSIRIYYRIETCCTHACVCVTLHVVCQYS